MMRTIACAAACMLLAAPAWSAPTPQESWGKAGVSFADYRSEAITCARQGAGLDVSHTDAAAVLIDASRKIDTITETGVPDSGNQQSDIFPSSGAAAGSTLDVAYNPGMARSLELSHRYGEVLAGARPEKQIHDVGVLMRGTVADCLTRMGYHRFRLTGEQQRHLAHLRRGSDARQLYLYSLASDPQVLREQVIA
jgi:hypothetical protein